MKKFIKKYKLLIIILILTILLVLSFFLLKSYIYNDDLKVIYGNRLNDIENYKINEKQIKKIEKNYSNEEIKIDIKIKGKIINCVVEMNKEFTKEELDTAFNLILNEFEKEKTFYDFQFFAKNKETDYYLIGYKNKNKDLITYSEYRKVDNNEEK